MFDLEATFVEEIMAHAQAEAPNECCGLLAGPGGRVAKVFKGTNSEASPTRYNVPPEQLLSFLNEIDERGWDLLGIYHSHTHTEAYPSATDVSLAFWPEALYFIVSLADPEKPVLRAFRIVDGQIAEEPVQVRPG